MLHQTNNAVSGATDLYHSAFLLRVGKDNQSLYFEIKFCQQLHLYPKAAIRDITFSRIRMLFPVLNLRSPTTRLRISKRMFQRWAAWSEQLRPAGGDVHVVFDAHSEFAGEVDTRLVAENHVCAHLSGVARHQVGPFVPIQTHAVSDAVGKVLEAWAVTSIDHDLARRGIDRFTRDPRTRRSQGGALRTIDSVENLVHLRCRFAQHKSPADV